MDNLREVFGFWQVPLNRAGGMSVTRTVVLMAALIPATARTQSVSPYEFAGFRLPATGRGVKARLGGKVKCETDRKEKVTSCHVYAAEILGADSGRYNIEWEVNDPTGRVQAMTFHPLPAAHLTEAVIDKLTRRWGKPSKSEHSATHNIWWGGMAGDRWMADADDWHEPDGAARITLRDPVELEAYNARARKLGQ